MHHRLLTIAVIFSLALILSCSGTSPDDENTPHFYEFTHSDGSISYSFVAETTDPEVIEKAENQLQLPLEQRNLHIHGDIERGNDGYNNNWSWHFTPDSWNLVEVSVEVCDGRPQMVEDNLDYWVDEVGYFCPWSSVVLQEVQP
jgi:hypothetical protein